jgi:hypothetical protein
MMKKNKTKNERIIELIYIFDSKKPNIISIKDILNNKLFGTKNFL